MSRQQKTKIFSSINSFKVLPLNNEKKFDETLVAFHIPHRKFFPKLERLPSTEKKQDDEQNENNSTDVQSSSSKIADISRKSSSQRSSSFRSSQVSDHMELIRKPPPPTTDLNDLIQNKIMKLEDDSFVYLNYTVPKSSEFFTPYSLIEVPFSRVNSGQFFTISRHGVTFWKNQQNRFTRLQEWYEDYQKYCNLMEIKSFRDYRLWKGFKVWQKTIQWRKYSNAQKFLAENFFLVIPGLRRAIVQLREEYCLLIESNFLDFCIIENWHLIYFNEIQMRKYEELRQTLRSFRSKMKEILYEECNNSLIAKGYHPNDEINMLRSTKRKRKVMSFSERNKKRQYCKLLSNFLTYCDNMTITLLQIIIKNSFRELVLAFQVHEELGPTFEDLNNEDLDIELETARPVEKPQNPFFIVDLILRPDIVDINPSEDTLDQVFQQLTGLILESVDEIERFTNDPLFLQFTEPSIMGRQEERLAGNAPDLQFVLKIDEEYQNQRKYIQDAIRNAYKKAAAYIRRFEPIRLAYETNMKTSINSIQAERDLNTLTNYCERFNNNISTLEKILPSVNLGVLKIKQGKFKVAATPICKKLLKILEEYLPELASEQVHKLTEMGRELMTRLNSTPKSTFDFVEYLRYLDDSGKELEKCFKEADYVHNLFSIMEKYNILVKDIQKEKYLSCDDLLLDCQKTIESKANIRQEFVDKLSESLQVEVEGIFEDVAEVRAETLDEKYIDKNTSMEDAKSQLTSLMDRLQQCQEQANEFLGYQREFKIEQTRYDELHAAIQDVKNRQNLWNTIEEWETALSRWQYVDFDTLDVEELNKINSQTLNMCVQFEKYLPPNELVTKIRESAEGFRAKLPVITCLRNPTLKARHWVRIENIINEKVYEEKAIKLSLYEEANAFDESNANEIIEISSHASSEAELEVKLRKVENTWKELDLIVVPHRESRDVFILSGIDELQSTLDEMNVIINTIAASKHVTPIKSSVDEWVQLLKIFGQTLEEWLACQSSWIYLEAIFSAADIRRQLPQESIMFKTVDKSWKDVMYKCHKLPLALPIMTDRRNLEIMANNNVLLESITRCLEAYLETKRFAFPRFFFLSNDELLEILAQTRNPHAVQPYLRKCFDAINRLEFGVETGKEEGEIIFTNEIIAMISPEGERMTFNKNLKARGPVDDWLGKVEEAMYATVKHHMKLGYTSYDTNMREAWFQEHASQVVLTVTQQQWAADVHAILDETINNDSKSSLQDLEEKLKKDLTKLAALTRDNIPPLVRRVLCALITLDVHAKDTVTNLITKNVKSPNDFDWLKMLRVCWSTKTEKMSVHMSSASSPYFHEYLGAGGVLVVTPLTDRCYLCLMGALQMNLGGSPTGPAGTGKTETTKDLAKAIAKQCVVFNCSEGLDYKMMGRFFSGLAQTGAWCCFDEFNRIDIEVLSVIAQQLITIRNAKALELSRFMFEGREMTLNMTCAAFITMNPGYAGRTELPDNLKALFRPIAMMVPDYALISEVILYSEGFENPKILAQKMVQLYKLCSEQLSQQSHYDFGLRAVKSVLVMAGTLKRSAPHQQEDLTLIMAMRDSNLPKFIAEDALLFKDILNDLFPGTELPITESGLLQKSLDDCFTGNNLQSLPTMITKCVQVYETLRVRCGVMLVGPTGGGKTTVLHTLASALTKLYENDIENTLHYKVNIQTLNPKAITLDELFGTFDSLTLEWKDGLLGMAMRSAVSAEEGIHQWIVCDGPVDAAWIENMNTVLDDNKMLCLSNSERIKLTPWIRMIFEVEDLTQASPATVSRCGMVYIDPTELSWLPLVQSWIKSIKEEILKKEFKDYLFSLFEKYCETILQFGVKNGKSFIPQVNNSKVKMVCQLISSQIYEIKNINSIKPSENVENLLKQLFYWSMAWSVGSNFDDESRNLLDEHLTKLFIDQIKLPNGKIWDFRLNLATNEWENWNVLMEKFVYNPDDKYFDMLVPTSDSVKFGYIAELLLSHKIPILLSGQTGVGKSVLAKSILKKLSQIDFVPILLNFSAQTSSRRTQQIIESRLEKRKKGQLGAAIGKTIIIFIDDVNMPKLDTYGSQSPIELLRQYLDYKGFYDRDKLLWKEIRDVTLGAACAPPGGGRNTLSSRFVRHFAVLNIPCPSDETLNTIFSEILKGHLQDFNPVIQPLSVPIVKAAVDVYTRIEKAFLPTPEKSHYTYNLRDLSKCVQGVLQSNSSSYITEMQILRLFYHESMRVFHDRLVNSNDKSIFLKFMNEACQLHFEKQILKTDENLLFGDFMVFGQGPSERLYEEIKDEIKLQNILFDYLDDYNTMTGKHMKLIFFQDAMEHTVRLARLLRGDRGNGLLVGVAGMGKQSLTRLAAHINGYTCFQIQLTRNYDMNTFHEDLRVLYRGAGVNNTKIVFLLVDTQIVKEEILEDINNILNSGEVPNLFEGDDLEQIIIDLRDVCNSQNQKECSRDEIFKLFIDRVRTNLHLVACMSPVGDSFRRRCKMFPSLVNCCTIDWFINWPSEALYSVALGLLEDVVEKEQERESLAAATVFMHKTVEESAEKYFKELRRHYYTTPSSYLELLRLYQTLLKTQTDAIINKRNRISSGLNKILETNETLAVMQKDLQVLVPLLEEQSTAMKELLLKLEQDTNNADMVKESVVKEEAISKEKAAVCQAISDDASKDLEIAMPALRQAEEALKSLNKNDINELKAFASPPQLIQFVMEAVCILLGAKPTWPSAKAIMTDINFLKKLIDYDKEHIPEVVQKKIKKYVEHKDFNPVRIEKVSKVAKSVSVWVIAIDKFAKVYKVVEPKIRKQEVAESELKEVMRVLRTKQQQLAEVEAQIQYLKDKIEDKNLEFRRIQENVDLTTARIHRAGRLTTALADEEIRWGETVKKLHAELKSIPGDVLIAAACTAYLGAFSSSYRKELCLKWIAECQKRGIPSSAEFNIVNILGDPFEMRNWNIHGLPRDNISMENGLYVTCALRWPLMIDPQEQANRWIRSLEQKNNLQITKMTNPNLIRILENCIRNGYPILIEDLGETIDPVLLPILHRSVVIVEGRSLIKLGETIIDFDKSFKLYMTTKLSNPHYMPEICTTVTLINFLVTAEGLEDQLLTDIVAIELPELEKQRSDLIVKINNDRQQLLALEDKVLKLLFAARGNILDDEELVETLNESKETTLIIGTRLVDTEDTESVITATREKYRTLSSRGSLLYFIVVSLSDIDPMYQYSLKYFTQIFCGVLHVEHQKTTIDLRISNLKAAVVEEMYANVSRGLFEKHKLIFSFLLATAIEIQNGHISEQELNFIYKGHVGDMNSLPKPAELKFLSNTDWNVCLYLEEHFKGFEGFSNKLQSEMDIEIGDFHCTFSLSKGMLDKNSQFGSELSIFEKLMLIKAFKKEKLINAVGAYVRLTLGKSFTEDAGDIIEDLYRDTNNITPLIFILSPGSDPLSALLRFTEEMDFTHKFFSISLGQGQGPAAEVLLETGRTNGNWIFLQNCHLATSWMNNLEDLVRNLFLGITQAHEDFRLYLSSMPMKSFPISILQNSVKVTNEPPRGLKANVGRALNDMNKDFFEHHVLGMKWRALIFGLCMFHGIIIERRKFGPLGWNVLYQFNESDRDCGLKILETFIDCEIISEIPWDALSYVNGEITWGGRVTDFWDHRCLRTILNIFSSPAILNEDYIFGGCGLYHDPKKRTLDEYKEYVSGLPFDDDPAVFGMHENANMVYQTKESEFFLKTLLDSQPRVSDGKKTMKNNEICLDILNKIRKALPLNVNSTSCNPRLLERDEKQRISSLTTVLFQEIDRHNNLLSIIHSNLNELEKAIKGFVVMSDYLESIFKALLNNLVPEIWSQHGFLSIKTLLNWTFDFQRRIDFIQTWYSAGPPESFWISGLFFPQSFLTGILQTHARINNIPIDCLMIDFEVLEETIIQHDIFEMHHNKNGNNALKISSELQKPPVGVYVHGLFIEAANWDLSQGGLCDPKLGELHSRLPVIWFKPCTQIKESNRYEAPLYKTQARAGILSTTGHSTNFILSILLKSQMPTDFWILRGTAIFASVAEDIS